MNKLNVYVDGFNLYHAIAALGDNRLKWLNLFELGRSFVKPGEQLNQVKFFTAVLTWEQQKQLRHKNYIRAVEAAGVRVIESNFRKMRRHCREMDRYCNRFEEKQTDVALALAVFKDAMDNDYDRAVLITADSDQVPLIRAVKDSFPNRRRSGQKSRVNALPV